MSWKSWHKMTKAEMSEYNKVHYDKGRSVHWKRDPCNMKGNLGRAKYTDRLNKVTCKICLSTIRKIENGILIKCNNCKRGIPTHSKYCLYCGGQVKNLY